MGGGKEEKTDMEREIGKITKELAEGGGGVSVREREREREKAEKDWKREKR